jgi:hypothetical protein
MTTPAKSTANTKTKSNPYESYFKGLSTSDKDTVIKNPEGTLAIEKLSSSYFTQRLLNKYKPEQREALIKKMQRQNATAKAKTAAKNFIAITEKKNEALNILKKSS